jgi:signal transduction histidine kinase
MAPDRFRKHRGFAIMASAPLTLSTAAPAWAQGVSTVSLGGIAPIAVAVGAGCFAILAVTVVRTMLKEGRIVRRRNNERIAGLRALVDDYENLIAGNREVTIVWGQEAGVPPRLFGQTSTILPAGRPPEALLDFYSWLSSADASRLARLVEDLRVRGEAFSAGFPFGDGRHVEINGWISGGGAALRLRPTPVAGKAKPVAPSDSGLDGLRAILQIQANPGFVRDDKGRLIYANAAYHALAKSLGKAGTDSQPAELLDAGHLQLHLDRCRDLDEPVLLPLDFGDKGRFELTEFTFGALGAGYLRPLVQPVVAAPAAPGLSHIAGIIDALATPLAIFSAGRELIQFNQAYANLWNFAPGFLTPGLDERAVLDKLRTEGMLPNQVDYHTWRAKHLESYTRKAPFEADPWHLPDGRTIKVISAPAGPDGGVIYVFEDLTERLELESANKAMSNVQRETINALSEAVAVFGTNGRLTLCNPRLSALWKLPMNELGNSPHIDQIAEVSGRAIPADGSKIWRDLKRGIIDLNPTRTDQSGRIDRSDGRLLDYAITRLPDGQTMMTFLDVTESASYSKVLKERNDALVAADRLKDAFVENVSYELRSPLTNIIGFADLLAAAEGDGLTGRQRAYIDYIRASSVTLGVLIDNILDLASVDAGIAELNPEPLDVVNLIEKARAGISATFPAGSGEPPNLMVDLPTDLPVLIADGTRLVQVLYNLLSNAARFSPPGGEIRLSVEYRGERVLFIIEDEGPGLTDEMKSAILTRLDGPHPGRQRGAGLALSIVRTFVNLHGGTITASPREPRGSRIVVNLPRDCSLAGVAE